jgi:hypothetical protein
MKDMMCISTASLLITSRHELMSEKVSASIITRVYVAMKKTL